MYAIIVYDISVERVVKVNKFLYQYLYWRQNSVFEGKLTKLQFKEIVEWFEENLAEEDRVIIYTLKSDKFLRRTEIGVSKQMSRIL
ncbi:MAG: CRISPR-associated endonuclease Cas2 [Candidatus Altiarchaeota archaeon]